MISFSPTPKLSTAPAMASFPRLALPTAANAPGSSKSSELIQLNRLPVARASPLLIACDWPLSLSLTQ